MSASNKRLRQIRHRIFLGCEGESERGYGAFISKLLNERRTDVHLDVVLLRPRGGNPLTLVQRAVSHIERNEGSLGIPYVHKALLLDSDQRGKNKKADNQAFKLAERADLRLIWQEPCHEALLLRHFEGCQKKRPQSSSAAKQSLQRKWPDYEKGMAALKLQAKFTYEDVLKVCGVEPSLRDFLILIGLISD